MLLLKGLKLQQKEKYRSIRTYSFLYMYACIIYLLNPFERKKYGL